KPFQARQIAASRCGGLAWPLYFRLPCPGPAAGAQGAPWRPSASETTGGLSVARIAELSLVQQVRAFGWRVFDLADGFAERHGSMASDLRQQAAGASRALARCAC